MAHNLVGAEVVPEDDVAFVQCWHKHLLDIGEERWAIHRTVDDVGRREAIAAKCGHEHLPVAVRHARDQTLLPKRAPVVANHLRRHGGLVDEYQARRIELGLLGLQCGARDRGGLVLRMNDFASEQSSTPGGEALRVTVVSAAHEPEVAGKVGGLAQAAMLRLHHPTRLRR